MKIKDIENEINIKIEQMQNLKKKIDELEDLLYYEYLKNKKSG